MTFSTTVVRCWGNQIKRHVRDPKVVDVLHLAILMFVLVSYLSVKYLLQSGFPARLIDSISIMRTYSKLILILQITSVNIKNV